MFSGYGRAGIIFPKAPPEQGSRLDFGVQGLAGVLLVVRRWVVVSSRRNDCCLFKTCRFVETKRQLGHVTVKGWPGYGGRDETTCFIETNRFIETRR